MNRATTAGCYRCGAPREQATLATVAERPRGVVLTPGLDEDHREVAWTLMSANRYFSAWRLGYVAAALLVLFPVLFLLTWVLDSFIFIGAGGLDPTNPGSFQLDSTQTSILGLLYLSTFVCAIVMVVVHSVFLALTSMNASALGSGKAAFGPLRAGLWYVESTLWVLWGWASVIFPIALVLTAIVMGPLFGIAGLIVGLLMAGVWFVCARWLMGIIGGPITSMGKPRRLHKDLMDRLGVPGMSDSRDVGIWAGAWATQRMIEYLTILGPLLIVALEVFIWVGASMLGLELHQASASDEAYYGSLIGAVAGFAYVGSIAVGFVMLARISIQLSKRQRAREAWMVGGYRDSKARVAAGLSPNAGVARAPAMGPLPMVTFMPQPPPGADPVFPRVGPVPSPVGARPPRPIPGPDELPPDDMTPDWSRPVFSTRAAFEAPPLAPGPRIPTSTNAPGWERAPQPFAPLSSADFPPAWRRAVEQPAAPEPVPTDRPVIQPSAASLPHYRPPIVRQEPSTPDNQPADPEVDQGM